VDDDSPIKHEINEPMPGSRRRTQVAFYGNPTSTIEALKRSAGAGPSTPTGARATRTSNRSTGDVRPSGSIFVSRAVAATPSKAAKVEPAVRGTRISRRLRDVEDEWQQVPAEWLKGENTTTKSAVSSSGSNKGKGKGKQDMAVDDDDESVLTELSGSSVLTDVPVEEPQPATYEELPEIIVKPGDERDEPARVSF
jgi:hypothetical protein